MKDKPFQPWLSSQDSVTTRAAQLWSWLQASFEKKIQQVQNDISSLILFSFESFSNINTQIFFFDSICNDTVAWPGKGKEGKLYETCNKDVGFLLGPIF